jgi:TRAP-type C4-dicarboxylate transport system substrate-binding protein
MGRLQRCVRMILLLFVRPASRVILILVPISVCPVQAADEPIQLKVLGGLATVNQYTKFEAPFWLRDVPRLTHDRVVAEIHPFDQSGLTGQETLQLLRLGVVPFGAALLDMVSADEPELNAVDLPLLNPDVASLRDAVKLWRGHLTQILRDKYGIELLGIYAYPAQVLFCARRFTSLNDLVGRRVRTSSVSQSEMMAKLGAVPVVIAFSDIVRAIRDGVVDCAITGTMSGNKIGLPDVTSYIYPMAISWGLSVFGANQAAWRQLPDDIRDTLRAGIAHLELSIWEAADRETAGGLACDIGDASCIDGKLFHMQLVPVTPKDEARRARWFAENILPGWLRRCGDDCATAWNETLGPALGISAATESAARAAAEATSPIGQKPRIPPPD